jgi:hypothetical protein
MYVYSSLRSLAAALGWLRREFFDWGNAIKNVWLIGANLAGWLFSVADTVGSVENAANHAAEDWRHFYDWIIHNLGVSNVPAELLRYADDLLSFIKDPFDWIADVIKDHFPELYKIARDPVEWVLETIYRYTGLDVDFVDNPVRAITNIVNHLIGDIRDVLENPYNWFIGQLDNIIPDFWRFINDARGWVRNRIEEEFPFLIGFINDPDGYIEDRLADFLENIADKYRDRAIKITEKIIDIIF